MVSNRSFPRIKIELFAIFAYFSRMSNLNINSHKRTINYPTSNVGSVVEFSPATREARVRFPDVASFLNLIVIFICIITRILNISFIFRQNYFFADLLPLKSSFRPSFFPVSANQLAAPILLLHHSRRDNFESIFSIFFVRESINRQKKKMTSS